MKTTAHSDSTTHRADAGGSSDTSDAAFIARLASGDVAGLGLLFDRFGGDAYALAYRMLGDRVAASAAVQETFLTLWRISPTFDVSRVALGTWFAMSIHQACIDVLRGPHPHVNWDTAAPFEVTTVESDREWERMSSTFASREVRQALATLPPDQRAVIEHAYFEGMTQTHVAAHMRVPLATVQTLMRATLEHVHAMLMKQADGEPVSR